MPNRIMKESICTSDSIDQLSWFEEVFFYRLIVNCDDFGRFDGRHAILKSRLFPLKDGITNKQIDAVLSKLSTAGMVQVYMYDQKPFLQLMNWAKHQTIRNQKSKYPQPPTIENHCNQLHADVPVIQSESNSESIYGAEQNSAPPPVFELPLADKSLFGLSQTDVDRYAALYPAVEIMQAFRGMYGWLDANPKKRKTQAGIKRFIAAWLEREQNRGGGVVSNSSTRQTLTGTAPKWIE